MKKIILIMLITIGISIYNPYAFSYNLISECMLGVPSYNRPLINSNTNTLPITINSNSVLIKYPDSLLFNGNVNVQQGNSLLHADKVIIHQFQSSQQTTPMRTIDAIGNVHYDDNQIILNGLKAWSNLNTRDTDVWNSDYQMVGRPGHGTAKQIKLRENNRYTIFKNGSFTSCLPSTNNWSIVGSNIIQDRQKKIIKIWNALFKIGNIPVFYSPYLYLPIGNERNSGFLIPQVKFSSNNGFKFKIPYYWNIAPQFDATITPYYISKRGLQLQSEFRYLVKSGTGLINFDYLLSDKQYDKYQLLRNVTQDSHSDRWMFHWSQNDSYHQHWRFNANYTKISDPYYLKDFHTKYSTLTNSYAIQKFSLGYADINWNALLSTKNFQLFDNVSNNTYQVIPQLDFNFYQNGIGPFNGHLYAQAVRLTNMNKLMPQATRLHIEQTLNFSFLNSYSYFSTQAKFLITHYNQYNIEHYNNDLTNKHNFLKNSVNRILPQLKIDGKLVFDRNIDSIKGFSQTLEPHVQYLYIPYRNQSNIYSYDSIPLQIDYNSLFRDRTYSGLDRISSTNKLTTSVRMRINDKNLFERFNASIGQIYWFTPSRTGIDQTNKKGNNARKLIWIGNTYWKVNNHWVIRGELQYNPLLNHISQGNALLEYHSDVDRMVQLNFRYSSPQYIAQVLNNSSLLNDEIYKNGISQIGTIMRLPISNTWSLVGSYYYDTHHNKLTEQLVGLQYSSCCYSIRLGYERKINGLKNNDGKYDNQFSFNVELHGLSSNYNYSTNEMLHQGSIPYENAF